MENSAREDSLQNFLSNVPEHLPEEWFESLVANPHVRIERIVSLGHCSAPDFWYDQPQHEWVMVIKGQAILQFEDRTLTMQAGDYVQIPARTPHRVKWTTPDEPTIWLAVHYGLPG